jgi:hypothetical protein
MPSYIGGGSWTGWTSLRWDEEETEEEAAARLARNARRRAARQAAKPGPLPEPTLTSKARRIDLDDE